MHGVGDLVVRMELEPLWRRWEKATKSDREEMLKTKPIKSFRDSFYRSKEWRVFCNGFLIKNTKCSKCDQPSKVVHHIVPVSISAIGEGFLSPLRPSNHWLLEPMCKICHMKEHVPEQVWVKNEAGEKELVIKIDDKKQIAKLLMQIEKENNVKTQNDEEYNPLLKLLKDRQKEFEELGQKIGKLEKDGYFKGIIKRLGKWLKFQK